MVVNLAYVLTLNKGLHSNMDSEQQIGSVSRQIYHVNMYYMQQLGSHLVSNYKVTLSSAQQGLGRDYNTHRAKQRCLAVS